MAINSLVRGLTAKMASKLNFVAKIQSRKREKPD
jgi:hypothetical protein